MPRWPAIDAPDLVERLAMDDEEFLALLATWFGRLGPREYDEGAYARAIGYPWERPERSFVLGPDGEVTLLHDLDVAARLEVLARFGATGDETERVPLLAIGSNGAPGTLVRKFAHHEDAEDRAVLVLAGHLHDFDVGVAANPALYGAMPATLFPSPGTAARTAVLWVTPTQFTLLAWSELTYRLGRLDTRFEADEPELSHDGVLAFVSRLGAFCPEGEPLALGAVPARGRVAAARTQEQLLDEAARMALGDDADARALVRLIYEDFAGVMPRLAPVRAAGRAFASERWTLYGV